MIPTIAGVLALQLAMLAQAEGYVAPLRSTPPPAVQSQEADKAWAASNLPRGWTVVASGPTAIFSIGEVEAGEYPLVKLDVRRDRRGRPESEIYRLDKYEIDCGAMTSRLLITRSWVPMEAPLQIDSSVREPDWKAIEADTVLRAAADIVCTVP